jgi:hypothetical protein
MKSSRIKTDIKGNDVSITCKKCGKPITKSNKFGMYCQDECGLMGLDKRRAICLKTGAIKLNLNDKHSTIFMFDEGQLIDYHESSDGGFVIYNLNNNYGFSTTTEQFKENFIDLAKARDNKIDYICLLIKWVV